MSLEVLELVALYVPVGEQQVWDRSYIGGVLSRAADPESLNRMDLVGLNTLQALRSLTCSCRSYVEG